MEQSHISSGRDANNSSIIVHDQSLLVSERQK